jgi:type I restriction enzyme S subunit
MSSVEVAQRFFEEFPAYSEYKDSGIDWLGEIPKHWEVTKLKYIGVSIIGITYDPKDIVQNSGTLVLRSSNIQKRKLCLENCVFIEKEIPEKLKTRKGDILICSRNGSRELIGKNITIDEETEGQTFGAFMTVFRTELFAFISKYFNSQVFSGQSSLFLTSTINQLTIHTINNFLVALPPIDEQKRIATFLDRATTEIDQIIEQQKQLINLLEEERTTVISHAVTKGLDPSVPMQASGIEWLGEIPKHWDVKRLKLISTILRGKFTHRPRNDPKLYDGAYPFIQTGDIATANKYITEYQQTLNEVGLSVSKMFPKGTLVMTIAANIGDTAILDFPACFPDSIVGFVPQPILNLEYLYHCLSALNTQLNLNVERIGSISIAYPSIQEQLKIVIYIESETARIDEAIENVRSQIEKLEEYRTVLISDAVTGKIDVRGFEQNV